MATNCLSCEVRDGKIKTPGAILFENDLISVTHSIPPAQCKGFMIVQPKRHVEQIADLTEEEMLSLSKAIRITAGILNKVLSLKKVYVCSFGESVRHVHFYVIPRTSAMPANGIEVLNQIIKEGKWKCSDKEAEEIALKIKEEFTTRF